jgi:hypothetical protein
MAAVRGGPGSPGEGRRWRRGGASAHPGQTAAGDASIGSEKENLVRGDQAERAVLVDGETRDGALGAWQRMATKDAPLARSGKGSASAALGIMPGHGPGA